MVHHGGLHVNAIRYGKLAHSLRCLLQLLVSLSVVVVVVPVQLDFLSELCILVVCHMLCVPVNNGLVLVEEGHKIAEDPFCTEVHGVLLS